MLPLLVFLVSVSASPNFSPAPTTPQSPALSGQTRWVVQSRGCLEIPVEVIAQETAKLDREAGFCKTTRINSTTTDVVACGSRRQGYIVSNRLSECQFAFELLKQFGEFHD